MKTLEYFKMQVAAEFIDKDDSIDLHKILTIAAERYGAHVWEEAIAAQKLIDAEYAKAIEDRYRGRTVGYYVDKQSIINSPDAVYPFKKTGYDDIIFPGKPTGC